MYEKKDLKQKLTSAAKLQPDSVAICGALR